jgi:bifunctional DNase/RNase
MEEKKVKLKVQGLTNSQIQSGAFALVLSEEGMRRLPIIVGMFEAQSIAIALEGLHPPRPLTHDLFLTFIKVTGLRLKEVFIHKFEESVFYSVIVINDGKRDLQIDSRTSDAISIALRAKCNIYTTEANIQKCSIMLEEYAQKAENDPETLPVELMAGDMQNADKLSKQLRSFKRKELEDRMTHAIAEENYEFAKICKDELIRREEVTKKS